MNNSLASGEQQELIGELRRRFPLLDQVVGRFGKDTREERIPWFFALLLAAATRQGPGACCFVLDKTRGTTATTAVLLALVRLQEDFPELVKNYARTGLCKGQRVKVKPANFVYEYDGIWEGCPELFRLKVIGEKAWRSFPLSDVLRLEPTDRLRPKGKGGSDLGGFKRSRLDELLDFTTCGNNSVIRNTVLLYMAQTRFAEVVDTIALMPEHANEFDCLSGFLPWGSIGQEGELKPNDTYQVTGEPIVAVTRVPEDLALASSSVTVATKVVLVDGANSITRDLQAFDDIANRQRMVILATSEETDALDLLRDRDCPIWHMSPDEILIGEACAGDRTRASLVGATIRAADMRQRVKVTPIDCQSGPLQAVAASLERAAVVIGDGEEEQEAKKILGQLYGILLEYSECCFGVGKHTRQNVRAAAAQLARYRMWLDPAVTKELQRAIGGLESIIASESFGETKAEALLNIILRNLHQEWVVAARLPRTAECLRTGLDSLGINVRVLSVPAISRERDYAGIICPAWPNKQKFTRLKNLAVTRDIRILTYPFENKWMLSYQARETAKSQSNEMEIEARSSILGIPARLLPTPKSHDSDPPVKAVRGVPIFGIEDRLVESRIRRPRVASDSEESRKAQLVQFVGDCYALLTEWAELHKLNQLMDKENGNEARLVTVTASRLSPGDYVLFRASGDREFIRLIAEDILGREQYERVRAVAERWRSSLRSLGTSPDEVRRRLAAHGLKRTTVTIAGWLNNPDHIGPRDFRDIEVIATASQDVELLSIRKEVEGAISRIRGAHISAGGQLTQFILGELAKRLHQLDDQPMLLDLDYGNAWVVQVDRMDMTRRKYPSSLVNRLLWADDTFF